MFSNKFWKLSLVSFKTKVSKVSIYLILVIMMVCVMILVISCNIKELPSNPETVDSNKVTESPPSLEASMNVEPIEPSIVLFTNIVAGDYSLLTVSSKGQVEFTRWNRIQQITEYRSGDIGSEGVSRLLDFFDEARFNTLDTTYDVYPLPEDSTLVYEDVYYSLKVITPSFSKVVIAHEAAAPRNLKEIFTRLVQEHQQFPQKIMAGEFVLVGDYEILRYKRFVIGDPDYSLAIDTQSLERYPFLGTSIEHPYTLTPVDNNGLDGLLSYEQNSIALEINNEPYYDVLLIIGEQ